MEKHGVVNWVRQRTRSTRFVLCHSLLQKTSNLFQRWCLQRSPESPSLREVSFPAANSGKELFSLCRTITRSSFLFPKSEANAWNYRRVLDSHLIFWCVNEKLGETPAMLFEVLVAVDILWTDFLHQLCDYCWNVSKRLFSFINPFVVFNWNLVIIMFQHFCRNVTEDVDEGISTLKVVKTTWKCHNVIYSAVSTLFKTRSYWGEMGVIE